MIEKINHSFAKLAFFSTFVMVSITLAGLFYFDTYLKAFGYDLTFIELDFYTLFMSVLILDSHKILTTCFGAVVTLIVMLEFFPKSLNFIIGIGLFLWLLLEKYILVSLLKFLVLIFLMLLKLINIVSFGFLQYFLIKLRNLLKVGVLFLSKKTTSEQKIVQDKLDFTNAFMEYEKSTKWVVLALGLSLLWIFWLSSFAELAQSRAKVSLSKDYQFKYQMFMIDKPQPINCQLILKLKTGYLVVVKDPKSGQRVATLFSDNVVEKISFKVDVKS